MADWNPRANELFLKAIQLDKDEREQYLAHACSSEADLRHAVETLLRAHHQAGKFLDQPPVGVTADFPRGDASPATMDYASSETPGTIIAGKYKLREKLGEGGMGSVWVADQTEPVQRRVAIKLIKAGSDSKSMLARFEQERQALALMDHPHIAKVFDAGVDHYQPYFVMELIKGVPLNQYCDDAKLTPQQRLELFVPVCQAVQHAHQKGIIHRDLKPSNILVGLYDGKPVPKVIDFGVAKATAAKLTDQSIYTEVGSLVGTLEYMSPEQAELNNLDIDTRTDIYALGVILYELLTGSVPFSRKELAKAGFGEMLRVIKEEEPQKPSTKLSGSGTLPSIAANRLTEPVKLTRLVKGDLDWIVMKALEKDRSRRYETANGFAADVQRYLSGEAVLAAPPSTAYRLRKFVRRNRGKVIAAGLVIFALLLGIAGTTVGLVYAEQRRVEADQAKQRESERADGEKRAKDEARQAAMMEKKARDQEAEQRSKAEAAYARTADVLDAMVSEVTGDSLDTQKTISAEQKKFLEGVLGYYREFAAAKGDDKLARARHARAAYRVGLIESRLGRKEEAMVAFRLALNGSAALATDYPAVPDYRSSLATSHGNLGILLQDLGQKTAAEEQYKKALAIDEKLAADFPTVVQYREGLALSHYYLGRLFDDLGREVAAEEQLRKGMTILERLTAEFPAVPEHRLRLALSHTSLGVLHETLGRWASAEEQHRAALAIFEKLATDFPSVGDYRMGLAGSHHNLGVLIKNLGRSAEAEGYYTKAIAIFEKLVVEYPTVPQYRQDLANSLTNYGLLLEVLGRHSAAEEQHKKAMMIVEKLSTDFPTVPRYREYLAKSHGNLANLLRGLGQGAMAEGQFTKALAIQEKLAAEFPTVPEYRRDLAASHGNLGLLFQGLGRKVAAEEKYAKAIAIEEKLVADFPKVPHYRSNLATSHGNLGLLLQGLGRVEAAEREHTKAQTIFEKLSVDIPSVPDYRMNLAASYSNLGTMLNRHGRRDAAMEQLRKGLAIDEKLADDFRNVPLFQSSLGISYLNIGSVIREGGDSAESVNWFDKAIARLQPVHDKELRDPIVKQSLRNSYWGRAQAYDQLQKYAEAINDWDKAIKLSTQNDLWVIRAGRANSWLRCGKVAEAVAEVTELRKTPGVPAPFIYDFACIYSLASTKLGNDKKNNADQAMEMLQKAVQAGYNDVAHMKKDTDLDPLRKREDFKKFIAELEKKFPPKQVEKK